MARLRAAGCVFAEDEAQLLVSSARTPAQLESWVRRRASGEPLEQVLGWVEFLGLRVAVDPGVFVPRRRTELLARQAVALARPGDVVLDLCCGSGAVGAAVAASVAGVELHLADIDAAAVRCARRNLADRSAHVHHGDLYAALPPALAGRIDVVVVNAPYVPTGQIRLLPPEARQHEPTRALDGGADGLEVQRRAVAGAGTWIAPGGHLLVETSNHLLAGTQELLTDAGLSQYVVRDDEVGATVVVGRVAGDDRRPRDSRQPGPARVKARPPGLGPDPSVRPGGMRTAPNRTAEPALRPN